MNTNNLNTALYEKMATEQEKYRDWLKSQPPEEVLNHAYEYTVREDIVMAMEELANTYGGVILLGVEELPDHTLRVQGLLEPRELVDEFTALLQNPRVVSANLLTPGDIQVLHVDGGDIVAITVPPAEQDQRPVYIGGDLARGSYRRSGDGDYHCTRAELNAMLGGRSH